MPCARLQPLQHHLAYHSGLCFPGGAVVKSPPANAGDARGAGSIPGLGRSPWTRKWQPTPIFLPGKLHGQRSLVGYSTWGCNESDRTEHTHTHTPSYSTLKSRDITLPTKVCPVKAMVFPMSCVDVRVGLWRRLSTEELMLLNCGVGEDSLESLGLQEDPPSPS